MGAKGSVEAAKMNAEGWGHAERGSRHYSHRHNQRSQSLNRGQALSRADVSGGQAGCASCAMGNKLSCSCAPLMRKAYRYEDSPWQTSRRRDGHLLRLWAEVFHVSASGAGTVKWQQVSEDLVPVNITCIQDSPECVFHITAYNSQVDKILDVRLVQPGTRIGQASECFVYWKDPMTNDTWGLNFTSPIDAKQFRECCSPSFKFSRKASSSYSLKLDPPGKGGKIKGKRKPLSTPASPSRAREPQCTCMSAEQYARLKAQDPRYRGSSTLPRTASRATDTEGPKVTNATSSTSLYDNVATGNQSMQGVGQGETLSRQTKSQETSTMTNASTLTSNIQNHVGSQIGQDEMSAGGQRGGEETSKSEGTQAGGTLQSNVSATTKSTGTGTRTKDYNDEMTRDTREMHHNIINNNTRRKTKSTEDMNIVDGSTLKRMLKPMPSTESPVTSPEMGRRRYNYYNANAASAQGTPHMHPHTMHHLMNNNNTLGRPPSQSSRFSESRSSHEIGRGYLPRNLYLELERERGCIEGSPPSDNVMFDNQCYATTPSSSNGNSDQDQSYGQRPSGGVGGGGGGGGSGTGSSSMHSHHHPTQPNVTPTPGSPTSRLLLEYEMHLRNTLAKGMDAESYSLHTFEALLTQSMENLEFAESLPGSTQRSPYPIRRPAAKSSTLPLPPHRPLAARDRDRDRDRERDGYYSDRNELVRERERERDRGYLSDHNSSFSNSRCASCIGESARAQWFRHSDGWRSGSSTIGSGSGQGLMPSQMTGSGHKRSPWDSLPSLRQDSSLNDSGYKSTRTDSLEQRGVFDRQDSLRSDYLSDRETRYGIVQQASIDSTDSRLCYLTSSECRWFGYWRQVILAASHHSDNEFTTNNNSSSADRKTFSFHCCCVIVDITPVAQGRSHLTTTTASGSRGVAGSGGGGAGGGGTIGGSEGGGVLSGLASSLFRFGSNNSSRKPGVCICNAQCRLGDGALGAKIHHGSLDRLLHDDLRSTQGQKEATVKTGAPSSGPAQQPAIEAAAPVVTAQSIRKQFDKGVEVEKFYHQINGDIFEITRRVRARDEETMEQKIIKRRGSAKRSHHHRHELVHAHSTTAASVPPPSQPEKPVLPPRLSSRQKSAEAEYEIRKHDIQSDWFDRTANLRHSARSAESGPIRDETIEWLNGHQHPQRAASGPSELTILKSDMPDWMSASLPRKQSVPERHEPESKAVGLPKSLKDELSELLKKPLSRQHSGPEQISELKHDILEWLAKLQNSTTQPFSIAAPAKQPSKGDDTAGAMPKHHRHGQHRRNGSGGDGGGGTGRSHSQSESRQRKRNSIGPIDKDSIAKEIIADWIPYPLHKLQSIGKLPGEKGHLPSQGSCVDLPKKCSREKPERSEKQPRLSRKLRHSASEVVTPISDRMPQSAPPPSRKEMQYQYIPKESQRTRRHQTQRSATVTDMFASKTHQPSSTSRTTTSSGKFTSRSQSPPCMDPTCPAASSICTDPYCRFVERYEQYTPLPPHCQLTTCQECHYSSLPRCTDPRCPVSHSSGGHRIKCNSLPRSAADLHRIQTTATVHYRSNSQPNTLSRGDSRTSIPAAGATSSTSSHHRPAAEKTKTKNGKNGKLMKSLSAASLNSRRRRHKTVHFGENLLREVCQNRKLIKSPTTPSGSAPMQPNIQMLYNFVEGVLSAWVDEDDDQIRSGAESEPERGVMLKPIHRCNRLRIQTIRRIVSEAAQLRGTLKLGNSRYRHRHWSGTAMECNERFLRKISDDDRMSLTTAVSDEDDGESVMASPYKAKATGTAASSFNCTGAVRKAGFLSVKKWLLRKKHQIELARKRGWKGYWVCLKGTTLLFYPCDSREGRSVEAAPKHLIIVDGAIMQPIPEHPKRDYIFCLSTAFGDAYLFQAPCQVELENWVNSIHSACAAAFARHRGKTGTLHLLQEEIFRLEKAIESDHKLKHMAELQQSVVTDQDTRHQIQTQILQWEENLERLHCEQFRLRCYMASLQSGELPNPKSLLTHVSRPTKNILNKLGIFTVSSFHAFICARSPSLLNNLLAGRGATKRRPPLLSRSNSGSSRRSMQMNSRDDPEKTFKVAMPDNNYATVYLRDAMSIEEFLVAACSRKNLNPMENFVRVKKRRDMEDHNYFVPHRNDLIESYLHNHEFVEVCMKILYQVELQRKTLEQMWGFSVEAELIENAERQDELCCYVSRVEDKSVAMQNGIIKGDEIMVINGAIVSDLDMMYLESVLQEEQSLCMMMRSSRTEPPDLVGIMRVTDDMIDSLVCPPPPSDPPVMSEEMISGLIVPAPGWSKDLYSPDAESSPAPSSTEPQIITAQGVKQSSRTSSFEIENLLKTAEQRHYHPLPQVTGFCRSPQETRKSSPTGSVASSVSNAMLTPSRQLTDAEKLRKVILELVDTERTYVKNLNNLLEYYLEPLKRETFLSNAEITALFGNIQEIVTFQRQFLQNLEEALELEPEFHKFEQPSQFKNVLFSIGSAFLYYVNHFKLYSSFCASHSKAQKVLHPNEGNQALQEFLAARNPKQQHSSTLESYLIKPIQRILKYPLLLQQLRNLTDSHADEHLHLVEALKGMEKVAEHINEMQRIHEEYGAIFDHLFRQHQKSCKQPIDLSPGDLLYYGGVEWLNISDFLGKIKKGLELHAMCFVFKSAVVFLCKERLRQKKKLMGVSSKNAPNEVEIIRYQVLIPVTEVQVRASSAKDMDSHFLWELIHLRSQLQRRSEKVYVLSNSTADFRNAFLKTIRQIIRESVRNMSIPLKGFSGSLSSVTGGSQHSGSGSSQTLERPKQQITIMQGSQTLGKPKKKGSAQRHSAGNIDYDNLSGSQEADDIPMCQPQPQGFRSRSKTVGDAAEPPLPPKRYTITTTEHTMDPGTKSEGEEDSQHGTIKCKATLGKTPNHLTLSTTSTLSVGSTGSQARLIQSSHAPSNYQPVLMKDLGSPVWKPRDMISLGDAQSTTRKDESK